MNRCTGHCCQVIRIPHSHAELLAGKASRGEIKGRDLEEAQFMGSILEPTGYVVATKRFTYRCTKFVDGDCTIYETRPSMCSEFPYGAACPYPECTADASAPTSPKRHLQVLTNHPFVTRATESLR